MCHAPLGCPQARVTTLTPPHGWDLVRTRSEIPALGLAEVRLAHLGVLRERLRVVGERDVARLEERRRSKSGPGSNQVADLRKPCRNDRAGGRVHTILLVAGAQGAVCGSSLGTRRMST
jgi:hypothetical protein